MNYKEAKKQVESWKPKDSYFIFTFGYNVHIVLPHKAGISLMESLNGAEQITDMYGDGKIVPMESEKYQVRTMSHLEYQQYKIAALLGVSCKEVQKIEEEAMATSN